MKRNLIRLLKALILAVLFVFSYWAWFQVEMVTANKTLAQLEFKLATSQQSTLPYDKTRSLCHKVLSHREGNHDSAFKFLCYVGNRDSIPYLIQALKWQDPPDGDVSRPIYSCILALEKTTGLKLGDNYDVWEKWWREDGSKLPPKDLELRASNHWARVLSERGVTPFEDSK